MQRGTSELTSRQMANLYKSGHSTRQIAEKAHITPSAVGYHLRKLAIPMRPKGNRVQKTSSKATISLEDMIKHYKKGQSLRQIAEIAGVTTQSVHGKLKRAGVEMRPQGYNQHGKPRYTTLKIRVPVRERKNVLNALEGLKAKVI